MKIAFVSQPFDVSVPPIEQGSIQIWTYQVALWLARDHDVTIYANRNPGDGKAQVDRGIRYLRFTRLFDRWSMRLHRLFHAFAKDPRKPPHASTWQYFFYAWRVARHIKREGYDLVHVHNYSQFVNVIRWVNPKVPIVLHMQGEWLTQLDREMIRGRVRKTDLILGCSDYLMSRLREEIPEVADRTRVIVNGVDPEKFCRAEANGEAERPVEILFVGRHSTEKGVHDLLDAAKILAERGRSFRLTVVGPEYNVGSDMIVDISSDPKVRALQRFYPRGPQDQQTYLAHLARQRADGLEEHVEFTGSVPHSALSDLYRRADILTNPSLSETFGIALVEGMASEMPVVATRVGGMVEIVIDGETGFIIESADPVALADALDRLILDADLRQRLGEAGRRRVLETYSWERIAGSLVAAYQEMLARQRI